MDLSTWKRVRRSRAKEIHQGIDQCKACQLPGGTDNMAHWYLHCLGTENIRRLVRQKMEAELGPGIQQLTEEEWIVMAKGGQMQCTIQKITRGTIGLAWETNIDKIADVLMEHAINSAITMFHISRLKEIEYWRDAKEHSKETWDQGKRLKGIDPDKEYAMTEERKKELQWLLSQEEQCTQGSNITIVDPQEFMGWDEGTNIDMEEPATDSQCTRCGNPMGMCEECLNTYCAHCERLGACPNCG
eukprot:gene5749-biopygen4266